MTRLSKQLWLLHVDQMTTLTWPAKTWLYNLPKLRFTPSEVKGFILLHQYRWIGLPKLTSIVLLFKRVSDIRRWPEAEMNWFAEATWLASILFLYRQQPARLPFGPCRQNSSLTRTSMPPGLSGNFQRSAARYIGDASFFIFHFSRQIKVDW